MVISNITLEYFVARAKAWRKLTPEEIADDFTKEDREIVYLAIGTVRGMTDDGQLSWSNSGDFHFITEEEARNNIPYMALPYDCEELHDIKVVYIRDIITKDRTEIQL